MTKVAYYGYIEVLRARWNKLMPKLNCKEGTKRLFEQIIKNYSEPTRHYHNLAHLLMVTYPNFIQGERPELVEFALWMHDFFDDRPDYSRVMEVTQQVTANQFNTVADQEYVSKLIEATFHKLEIFELYDQKLIADIDLSILSSSPEEYLKYTDKIRKEYAHVSDEDFRIGRLKILKRLNSKDIYHTTFFKKREAQAKSNLAEEISRLENP
jgi:predicted metal-dependent HD superfamily phosphohydrolase